MKRDYIYIYIYMYSKRTYNIQLRIILQGIYAMHTYTLTLSYTHKCIYVW
jgi:hypothetical protein